LGKPQSLGSKFCRTPSFFTLATKISLHPLKLTFDLVATFVGVAVVCAWTVHHHLALALFR
jgi:hypothetical protein